MGSRMFGFRSLPFFGGKLIPGNLLLPIHHAGFTYGKPPLPTKTTIKCWPCPTDLSPAQAPWRPYHFGLVECLRREAITPGACTSSPADRFAAQ